MFELYSGEHRATPHGDTIPMLVSSAVHVVLLSAVALIPILFATHNLPDVPTMMAFVAELPPPPPPPPPPAVTTASTVVSRPVPTVGQFVAPIEAPSSIVPESPTDDGGEGGVPGGVEGGMPWGVLGGIPGGLTSDLMPPPPPVASPPPPRAPIRAGGEIQPPALLHRVDPTYPELAISAKIEGIVILEATVGRDGRVEDVHVLRGNPILQPPAVAAVEQWVYAPLLLNGKPERFVLSVTVSFRLNSAR